MNIVYLFILLVFFIAVAPKGLLYGILVFGGFFVVLIILFRIFRKKPTEDEKLASIEEARRKREEEEEKKREHQQQQEIWSLALERERLEHRDSDVQDVPYSYEIGKHANEALAIRYGIANLEKKTKEYWFFAKGGERKRNPERDTYYYEPANTIRLRKLRKIGESKYLVAMEKFRDRQAVAIIEKGTEFVKTFYPMDESWFKLHADLELTLKGNGSFSLKELATFHIQKAVGGRTLHDD